MFLDMKLTCPLCAARPEHFIPGDRDWHQLQCRQCGSTYNAMVARLLGKAIHTNKPKNQRSVELRVRMFSGRISPINFDDVGFQSLDVEAGDPIAICATGTRIRVLQNLATGKRIPILSPTAIKLPWGAVFTWVGFAGVVALVAVACLYR